MRLRRVLVASLAALALGAAAIVPSASAQGQSQSSNSSSPRNAYVPPGPMAPVVIIVSTEAASAAAAVVMPPGVPAPRDEISVRGAYAGADGKQLYCIVYSRGC